MADLTLESLAQRLEAVEQELRASRPKKDWRRVVGMFRDSEFMREVDDECLRSRELEREAARLAEPEL